MTEEKEQIAPGIVRQVASSNPRFEPFTSITGAGSNILVALSREDDKYRTIPLASISFRAEDGYQAPAFTLAVDDLAFVNLVLSTSLREIVIAYGDGAVSNIKEPAEVAERLVSLADHWENLAPTIRKFAEALASDTEKTATE